MDVEQVFDRHRLNNQDDQLHALKDFVQTLAIRDPSIVPAFDAFVLSKTKTQAELEQEEQLQRQEEEQDEENEEN